MITHCIFRPGLVSLTGRVIVLLLIFYNFGGFTGVKRKTGIVKQFPAIRL